MLAAPCTSDGSSGHIFTTAVAVVCAVVELFSTAVAIAVAVFGCPTTAVAVAVVGCDEYKNYFD